MFKSILKAASTACLLVWCVGAAPGRTGATSQPDAAALELIDKAIKTLAEQSETFTSRPGDPVHLEFRRPQKFVAELKPEWAQSIVQKILKPITGEPLKDSYIRFHLMPIILKASEADRKAMSRMLLELGKQMPDEIVTLPHREPNVYDPPELGKRYQHLVHSCVAHKGFPPFVVAVYPPESFQFMDGERRRKCEAMWAEAQQIKPKLKIKPDPSSSSWNAARDWHLWMQRQYRGELFMAMYTSCDPSVLSTAATNVAGLNREFPLYAADAAMFLNAAYFSGALNCYDAGALRGVASKLKQSALTNREWKNERNLGETVLHLVRSIEGGRKINPLSPQPPQPAAPTKQASTAPVTAETLDLDRIDAAIERASAALLRRRPPLVTVTWHNWALEGWQYYPWHLTTPGHQALVCWALLASGQSYQSPELQWRIDWVLSQCTAGTYDRAMRLQMLRMLPRKGWEDYVRRDRESLLAAITDQGNFPDRYSGGKSTGYADNANGQYGMLALAAVESMRQPVPAEIYKKIDTYWRDAQFKDGGWSMVSTKVLKPGVDPGEAGKVSGPMTASGILALSQTERGLFSSRKNETLPPHLQRGVQWLDRHFDLQTKDVDNDWYYYMWTVQNVGHVTGYRAFNKIDWFRQGTAKLLNEQTPDGLWKGPKGELVSTSFALLYLYRARGPLAVCKVRFESSDPKKPGEERWNLRPSDMMNFTDYVTETFETPTSWQIADLNQPLHELIESRLMYLATDYPFELRDDEIEKLRSYIQAGGTLVMAPEGVRTSQVVGSMKALAEKLYPSLEPQKLTPTHAFYSLGVKTRAPVPGLSINNSVRPLVVIVERDIGRELQAGSDRVQDSFALLTNIYLYAAGRDARRPRLASDYIIEPSTAARTNLSTVRIKYEGEFDPEPNALQQLSALLKLKHDIQLQREMLSCEQLSEQHKLAFLTVTPGTGLPEAQAKALRNWLRAGGTLWIDCAGGSSDSLSRLEPILGKLRGDGLDFRSLSHERILAGKDLSGGYDVRQLAVRKFGDLGRMPITVGLLDGRPAVYVAKTDLCSGLAGLNHWGIAGYEVATARKVVINTILNMLSPDPNLATAPPPRAASTAPAGGG